MKLFFNVGYRANADEKLQLVINEDKNASKTHAMFYTEDGFWKCEVDYFSKSISYHYQLVDDKNNVIRQEFVPHRLSFPHNYKELLIFDQWNSKNFPENYLNNKILYNKLNQFVSQKSAILKKHSHLFRIEAPVYNPNWEIVLFGNVESLGNWDYKKAVHLAQTDFGIWETSVEISENSLHIQVGQNATKSPTTIRKSIGQKIFVKKTFNQEKVIINNKFYEKNYIRCCYVSSAIVFCARK